MILSRAPWVHHFYLLDIYQFKSYIVRPNYTY
jgi:hypothetical protein